MIDRHTRSSHQALRQGRSPCAAASRKLLLGPCGLWSVTSPSSAIAEIRLKCLGSVPENSPGSAQPVPSTLRSIRQALGCTGRWRFLRLQRHLSARPIEERWKSSSYIRLYCIHVPRPNVRYPSPCHHLQRLSAKYPRAGPDSAGLMDRRRVPALRREAPAFAGGYFPGSAVP